MSEVRQSALGAYARYPSETTAIDGEVLDGDIGTVRYFHGITTGFTNDRGRGTQARTTNGYPGCGRTMEIRDVEHWVGPGGQKHCVARIECGRGNDGFIVTGVCVVSCCTACIYK